MGSDLSAAHWLLRYSVRLREREHEATELRTFSVRPEAAPEPLLLPPGPVPAPRRRHRRAVVNVPVVDVEATDVDVPVFVDSYAPPPVVDPTDIDAVRVIFESARAPNVATDVDTIFRTPSFASSQSVTDRMPNVAEAEWTPLKVEASATSPRAVFVVARDLSPSPFVSVHVPDEIDVLTPTSVSDLRGTIVSRPPRVTLGLSLTPPPLPERPRLLPPPVFLEPPTPPPAHEAAAAPVFVAPPPAHEPRILALPPAELPNPWAAEIAPEPPTTATTPEPEESRGSIRRVILRGGILLVVSAVIGVGIQTGIARARRHRASPAPAAPAVTLPVAAAAAAAPVVLSPTEGDLEIHAPPAATITVDGKVRGTGPTLSMKLAPGYHTVRVGLDKTAIVEVHRGVLAAVDLSK